MDGTHRDLEQIERDLDAAVVEHERVGREERESYGQRLDAAIDDVLALIGRTPEKEGRRHG